MSHDNGGFRGARAVAPTHINDMMDALYKNTNSANSLSQYGASVYLPKGYAAHHTSGTELRLLSSVIYSSHKL